MSYKKSKIINELEFENKNKKETKNNYIILTRDFYLYPNIITKNVKIIKTPEKKLRKKQINNKLNLSKEINIENKFNEINESFHDKKRDKENLIIQISDSKNINEAKLSQAKTPDKNIKYFKKSIINRAKKIKKEINYYDNINNNISTATFNNIGEKNKKYNEFTFYDKDKKLNYNNNINNNKILFGKDEKSLKMVNDNIMNGKYRFLLKLQKNKNKLKVIKVLMI